MSLNPRDYDTDELRSLNGARAGDEADAERPPLRARYEALDLAGEADAGRSRADRRVRASQLERLYFLASATPAAALDRPYLRVLPQTQLGERLVVDWLEYLVDRGGRERATEALAYYRSVDWLSPAVEETLREYLTAYPADSGHASPLGVEDHRLSLLYVAKLATLV